MKRYYNPNTKEWYTEGSTITKRVDNGVFSGIPSVEQITARLYFNTNLIDPHYSYFKYLGHAVRPVIQ